MIALSRAREFFRRLVPHRELMRAAAERVEAAQKASDEAQRRLVRAKAAAERSRRYRQENRFASLIADSLGLNRHDLKE